MAWCEEMVNGGIQVKSNAAHEMPDAGCNAQFPVPTTYKKAGGTACHVQDTCSQCIIWRVGALR
jgi:hypothetical protein